MSHFRRGSHHLKILIANEDNVIDFLDMDRPTYALLSLAQMALLLLIARNICVFLFSIKQGISHTKYIKNLKTINADMFS